MRHQKAGRRLGRATSHRNALFRNMLASFFDKEKIETTTAKAKELRPLAEKLITLGKRGDLHARRSVLRIIPHTGIVRKLFTEIAPRFERRAGGYTRIIRTGYRAGDQAPMSVIELVVEEVGAGKKKEKKKKKALVQSKAEVKKAAAKAAAPARQDEERQKPSEVTAPDHQQAGPKQVQPNLPEETTALPREESADVEEQAGKESSGAASAAGGEPEKSSEK